MRASRIASRSLFLAVAALFVSIAEPARAQSTCTDVDGVPWHDGAAGHRIGAALAIDGLRLAVGAHRDDDLGISSGSVELFEHTGPGAPWTFVAKLVAASGAAGDDFGYALDLDGDRLAVGAYRRNASAAVQSGAVHMFERQFDGSWLETAELTLAGAAVYDWFGRALDLEGDRLVVGAPFADPGANGAGAAAIFERDRNGVWAQVAALSAAVPTAQAKLGSSVALDGDRVVLGAPGDSLVASESGALHVFERQSDGSWIPVAVLRSNVTDFHAHLGESVALLGDTIVGGAPGWSITSSLTGAIFFFEHTAPLGFTSAGFKSAPVPFTNARYGASLALRDGRLAVGAPGALDGLGSDAVGTIDVLAKSGGVWQSIDVQYGSAPNDQFGSAVDVAGDEVAAGASQADTFGLDSGEATSFRVVAALSDVLLVDSSANAAECGDPWDLAFTTLEQAIDAALADPALREIRVAAGTYRLSASDLAAALPSGLRVVGGFPPGGGTLDQRDPTLHSTRLAPAQIPAASLKASYFTNINLSGTPVLVQQVAQIDNDWAMGSPITPIDNFSIRWDGFVESPASEIVSFYTTTDDGVRLWVDNVLVINQWVDQSATEHVGTINLVKGVPVPLRMEFYEKGGDAVAKLAWSSASIAKEPVPPSAFETGTPLRMVTLNTGSVELDGIVLAGGLLPPSASDQTGGAVRISGGAELVLRNCTLDGNTATGAGGALRIDGAAHLVAIDCVFTSNSSTSNGGALSAVGVGTRIDILGGRFEGNASTGIGGALHFGAGAEAFVTNTLLVSNRAGSLASATQEGGAAAVAGAGAVLELLHATVVDNAALGGSDLGGGLVARAGAVLRVHNSVLWGNSGLGAQLVDNQIHATTAACVEVDASIVQGWLGGVTNSTCASGMVSAADPQLDGNWRLAVGSPGVDAGSVVHLSLDTFDLDGDGDVREELPIDGARRVRRWDDVLAFDSGVGAAPLPDLGAFERGTPPSVSVVDCLLNPSGSLSLAAGSPDLGGAFELTLVDPTGAMGTGSIPILVLAAGLADPIDPCGLELAGVGLSSPLAPGTLIVDAASAILRFGTLLGSPGAETTFTVAVPSDPSFAGASVVLQGVLLDPLAGNVGLTNGLVVALGQSAP